MQNINMEPTPAQMKILDAIVHLTQQQHYAPTIREIGAYVGFSNPNAVVVHLKALEKKGIIRRTPSKARSIILISHERNSNVA